MTITRSDCRYYINEIKDLAKNFDDKTEQKINDKAKSVTASQLKKLYKSIMEEVYGDNYWIILETNFYTLSIMVHMKFIPTV